MTAAWITCTCTVRESDVAQTEAVFEQAGAAAVTCTAADDVPLVVDKLDGEQPLWPVCNVTGLFAAGTGHGGLESRFSTAGVSPLKLWIDELADRQWQSVWREHFEPRLFGGCLCVCPTWREPVTGCDHVIRIDPGMAFGTGNHATTALCLEWIATPGAVSGCRVLDYGCGSGILALAAATLGAASVEAIDIDAQALVVCERNAALNQQQVVVSADPALLRPGAYDLIVANILLEPLLGLAGRFGRLLAPGGRIVLSGVLAEQVPDLLAAYAGAFKMDEQRQTDGWALVAGTLNDF